MLEQQELIALAKRYFTAWNNHDLSSLKQLMSHDIELVDWEINCVGINDTLEANSAIFRNNPDIEAQIVSINSVNNIVFARINVLTNKVSLNVMDILTFNSESKLICKIDAYRQ